MSITALQMITDALRLVNVIDEMEDPSAEQGASALRVLNQMAGQWDRDGIRIGWQVVSALSDNLPIEYQDERAVRFNLAVELAGDYGIEPLPRVTQIARKTYDGLAKAHAQVVECSLDHLPQAEGSYISGSIESG